MGFSTQDQLNQAYRSASLKSSAVNKYIYLYPHANINEIFSYLAINHDESNSNSIIHQNESNPSIKKDKFDPFHQNYSFSYSEIHQNDQNKSNSTIHQNESNLPIKNIKLELFHQNDDLYYIYFKEKKYSVFNHEENICSLFEIQNIENLQRGFKLNENDTECYTFMGFLKSIDANSAMNTLFKNKQIDALSINKLENDDDDDSSISSSYKDDSESDFDYENEEEMNLLFYSKETLLDEKIHLKS